ncbi:hypothetical protein GCM10022224_005370 [Nonomuraea antimicrobica]|uniref:DUF3558 domain-containing protein n=1 Tax=Nonomuraea antimicrobica TaxID=561173 RepID=A0ABP7B264_9ACTN
MRWLAAVLLVSALTMPALTGCGAVADEPPEPRPTLPPPRPAVTGEDTISLACDETEVRIPGSPSGLAPAGTFARLDSLSSPLEVSGRIWSDQDERMYVGVVCGVRTAEQFATLVAKSSLAAYRGKPALHWTTRTGVRSFMWLERPGTAVYIGATPGLTSEIRPIATDITADASVDVTGR